MATVHVEIPTHQRSAAKLPHGEIALDISGPVTQRSILDALEAKHPILTGMVRDHHTGKRRDFLRFFACQEDHSLDDPDAPVPAEVASGKEPFIIIGAVAGGTK